MDFTDSFFKPRESVNEVWNRLPHWHQPDALHFITFRLEDSIPRKLLDRWNQEEDSWRAYHPEPWSELDRNEYWTLFPKRKQDYMDRGEGSCLLKNKEFRDILGSVLNHFNGRRFENVCWIIMPNHVHILSKLLGDYSPSKALASWKRQSAQDINRARGAAGTLWAEDYFDTIIRNYDHLHNCIRYTRRNPDKARLPEGMVTLFESEYARNVA